MTTTLSTDDAALDAPPDRGPSKTPRPAASRPAPVRSGPRSSTPRSPRMAWVLALVGLIGTVTFGLLWLGARGGTSESPATAGTTSGENAEILQAARSFSKSLTNFDGATIDRDFDRITAKAAGEFRSQADDFFSSEVRAKLKETQASSRGEVRSAFVQDVDGDHGSVFVVVDQTVANNLSPQPQADTLRMELGLVLRNGTWKVQRVSVLTAPTAGAGATSDAPATGGGGN